MEMINMCIYADTTGLYSEAECNSDNLIDMDFPEEIVRKWYDLHKDEFKSETAYDLKKPYEECTFEDWLNEVSWAGDTDRLYDFSVKEGYTPTLGITTPDAVFYRDEYNYKRIVFEGTYDECRQYGKDNGWEYEGFELEILGNS